MKPSAQSSDGLSAFLVNAGFRRMLEQCWEPEGGYYREPTSGLAAVPGLLQYMLLYHVYGAMQPGADAMHQSRAEKVAGHLSRCVLDDGLLLEPAGNISDHPANACHVADGLGTFCYYAAKLGWDTVAVDEAKNALVRIVEQHHVVRVPDGISGRTQQMRFELRAYYWAWRVTGDEKYRKACLALWANGINAYQNPIALSGALIQPSLHPDFTWNYTCTSGTTTEYATNTHTPVYYCTEPQGFVFVYLHGLRDGVFERNPVWDTFCRKFLRGLMRNISRAGHTSSDVDGYGIHRAWYSGCLVESVPVEAIGAADIVGLSTEEKSWFRWYVGRYVDFIRRGPDFEKTGLLSQCAYSHNITIEKQFPSLLASRFYAQLARGLHEYGIETVAPVEPPPMFSYAWWQNWVRVSTPVYETSFVGTTSLCGVPVARHYGDPNLGCIHGGAALATLFAGDALLYATSNDPESLWHVELIDVNGNLHRSAGSSFEDETTMTVKTSDGRLLTQDSFEAYQEPVNGLIGDVPLELSWAKNLRRQGLRFFVKQAFSPAEIDTTWGFGCPRGFYVRTANFVLTVPATLEPEVKSEGAWTPLCAGPVHAGWPEALRWRKDGAVVTVALATADADGGVRQTEVRALPTTLGRPGGENSFCPYPLLQVRLGLAVGPALTRASLNHRITFTQL